MKKTDRDRDRTRWLEIIAVVATGIGKFVFMDFLNWRLPFISLACLGWFGYIFYRYKKDKSVLQTWGLNGDRFKQTFFELLPVAMLSVLVFYFLGTKMGTNILNWHIAPILLLYPIWGIIQQFIIVGLIAGNLQKLEQVNLPTFVIVGITASIFAIVHYPFYLLIAGTFLLAIVYTLLYLNNRNLIAMGIYHGWIGAFFFYTLLARDPWLEVFNMM